MVTDWRVLVPADVMESVFWEAAGPLVSDGEPSAVLRAGWRCARRTGMLVNLADTPENRAMFGCTGTAEQDGEGATPFPQLVALTARAGRAMLGAILGSTRAGEQRPLRRLARGRSPRAAPQEPRPVTAYEESFTVTWRHTIRSVTSSQVTATSSLEAIAAAAHADARAALHTLSVPGRQRHSWRAQKARPNSRPPPRRR